MFQYEFFKISGLKWLNKLNSSLRSLLLHLSIEEMLKQDIIDFVGR